MATKDIEKLKEKFDKDPNSKLFLPLAEEYRKEGMLDEAIDVLKKGLEKHSTYTSARVLLGKTYLEKGMPDEARGEFEGVIKIVPDNLFAHKKLAELYRDTGEFELALKAYKAILKLNPMDEESVGNLRSIEAALAPAAPPPEAPKEEVRSEMTMPGGGDHSPEEEPLSEVPPAEDFLVETNDIRVEHSDEELNAFKDSLFGEKTELGDDLTAEEDFGPGEAETAEEAIAEVLPEEDASSSDPFSFGDIDLPELETAAAQDEVPEIDLSFGEIALPETAAAILPEEEAIAPEAFAVADDRTDEGILSFQDMEEVEIEEDGAELEIVPESAAVEAPAAAAAPDRQQASGKAPADMESADRFVAEGLFAEAIGVYRRMLAAAPGDRKILQRTEELKGLLKMMGRDKEMLIDALNAFREGIEKGRDEFFGHS